MPIQRLSSRPTRTLPPIAAAIADRHLRTAGAQHRPAIIIVEQAIGGALHMHDVFFNGQAIGNWFTSELSITVHSAN